MMLKSILFREVAQLEKYLTPEQVAEILQVSLITVKRWLTARAIPGYKVGRQWRVDPVELEAWIKKQDK